MVFLHYLLEGLENQHRQGFQVI
ncbi:hypothetical protein LCGC14_1297530, partial [marine sediment metagenome]